MDMVGGLKFFGAAGVLCKIIHIFDNLSGYFIDEATLTKLIRQLNETIGVILEYLEDAKVFLLADNR